MPVLDYHAMTLEDSSVLSRYYMPTAILPADVIRVLDRARIPFILVGAHGAFGWMQEGRPRMSMSSWQPVRTERQSEF
jgi:hypothetical protein